MMLSDRFDQAMTWASQLHREQSRKASDVPYVSHLLAVAAMVLEHGGDEDQAIAALLHDAVEDQAVEPDEIASRFGERVARIVVACSDRAPGEHQPWRQRKERLLAHLADPGTPPEALLVACADKVHNARSILSDYRRVGDAVWERFNDGREAQRWYYETAGAILAERLPGLLTDELMAVTRRLFDEPDPEPVLAAMATTRAIRRYRPDPIPDEHLARILFAASRAPSGSNRMPFRFLVLRDGPRAREAKSLLGRAFREGWSAKQESDGYGRGQGRDASSPKARPGKASEASGAGGRKARMARAMQQFVDHFEEIPVVVLACLERYRAPNPTEGGSVYPACQNLLLAARALGYGGVLTMWHAFVEDELRALLGIPEGTAISATITLGRPLGHHGPVRRRPLAELVYEDTWAAPASWATDPPGTRFSGRADR